MKNQKFLVKKGLATQIPIANRKNIDAIKQEKITFKKLLKLANASAPLQNNGVKTYRGFTYKPAEAILDLVPGDFWMVEDWCDHTLRVVWISKKYLSIFTYIEGDLILEVCDNIKVYNEKLENVSEFYKEH